MESLSMGGPKLELLFRRKNCGLFFCGEGFGKKTCSGGVTYCIYNYFI